MDDTLNFTESLKNAIAVKTEWFNNKELYRMLENYRLLHTCVKNIYNDLISRSLITPDPYKLEKKISDISVPADSQYKENERALVIGARFSDYESMLDFICTYFKFSVDNIDLSNIRKLNDLNNAFQWSNFSPNNAKTNTRGLAVLVNEARKNAAQMTLSMINDSITKSAQAVAEITKILKELTDFQRELYKEQLRIDIFGHPSFNKEKASKSPSDETAEIKRIYGLVMGKKPFYSELIEEIINEDQAPNKEQLQQTVLQKLKVNDNTVQTSKKQVDTKAMLMDTIRAISFLAPEYAAINEKLNANYQLLESGHNTFFDKFKQVLRKMFNMQEPPVIYNFVITEPAMQKRTVQAVNIISFMEKLDKRTRFLTALANKTSAEYQRIEASGEEAILNFANKQISEDQNILTLLTAADEYFKEKTPVQYRNRVKGLKIDLIAIKNAIVKTKLRRADYSSYIEEISQMKKLGIEDAE